jgi:hypothetical protein
MRLNTLLSCLPLPGSEVALIIPDAINMAKDPDNSIMHCPWGPSRDRPTRARRAAWRLVFRWARERGEVPPITLAARRAA